MAVVLALLAVIAAALLLPFGDSRIASRPRPAHTYEEALTHVDALQAADTPAVAADCGTELLTHGQRSAHVVVLLHGLTNCPAQFDSLARLAYEHGANVLVPRLPHHGLADRMTDELARLDAAELCGFTDRVLDAAHGLGDTITVAGLSIGGVMTAWAAQERGDIDRAVIIAPMIGWARAPGALRTRVITRLGLALPNAFVWWDDVRKQDLQGPKHVYPRFASRSVAATLWLGGTVLERARRVAPAARSVVMVTVGGDLAADNTAAAELVSRWREHGTPALVSHEFPASLKLNHDVVDPEQVGGNPALSYPVLLRYISR